MVRSIIMPLPLNESLEPLVRLVPPTCSDEPSATCQLRLSMMRAISYRLWSSAALAVVAMAQGQAVQTRTRRSSADDRRFRHYPRTLFPASDTGPRMAVPSTPPLQLRMLQCEATAAMLDGHLYGCPHTSSYDTQLRSRTARRVTTSMYLGTTEVGCAALPKFCASLPAHGAAFCAHRRNKLHAKASAREEDWYARSHMRRPPWCWHPSSHLRGHKNCAEGA